MNQSSRIPSDTACGGMSSPVYYNQDSVTRFKKRKARFSFSEVHILLDEVRKHRMVVVGTGLLTAYPVPNHFIQVDKEDSRVSRK